MNPKIRNLVYSAMMASLICVATMLIKIPSPLKGYINLGDCFVLLSGWLLTPFYGFMAAGLGSMLADIFGGYPLYAPATFIIKGIMALTARFLYSSKSKYPLASRTLSATVSELVMVAGYYVFEGILYGFYASAVNIPFNLVQGFAGVVAGVLLIKVFEKNSIIH